MKQISITKKNIGALFQKSIHTIPTEVVFFFGLNPSITLEFQFWSTASLKILAFETP